MRTRTISAVALTAMMLGPMAMAAPATAASPVVTKEKREAVGVFADFLSDSPDGCIHRAVGILVNVADVQRTDTPEAITVVGITEIDRCRGVFITDGFAQTDAAVLDVASNLSTARTKFEVTFNDFVKGTTYPVSFDVSFKANTEKVTLKTKDRIEEGGVLFRSSQRQESRNADAVANLVVDGVPFFNAEPSDRASIDSDRLKSRVVDRTDG
jgi:hypothetical protein